jgi:cell division protein FtsZ
VNITGGQDLTLGEVNQISEIIHEAAGDQAEIIFGAVTDPAMEGEVRVTVIATGFDKALGQAEGLARGTPGVLQFPPRTARPSAPQAAPAPRRSVTPSAPPAAPPPQPGGEVPEMEIPTFIRRQMD